MRRRPGARRAGSPRSPGPAAAARPRADERLVGPVRDERRGVARVGGPRSGLVGERSVARIGRPRLGGLRGRCVARGHRRWLRFGIGLHRRWQNGVGRRGWRHGVRCRRWRSRIGRRRRGRIRHRRRGRDRIGRRRRGRIGRRRRSRAGSRRRSRAGGGRRNGLGGHRRRRELGVGEVGRGFAAALRTAGRALGPRLRALLGRALAGLVPPALEQRAHVRASSQPSSSTAAARASSAASPGTREASVVVKRSS
jgi:hypothetical protein